MFDVTMEAKDNQLLAGIQFVPCRKVFMHCLVVTKLLLVVTILQNDDNNSW